MARTPKAEKFFTESEYSATHLIAYRLIAYPVYSVRIWKNKNKTYSFLL